jgi:hypothetical protein
MTSEKFQSTGVFGNYDLMCFFALKHTLILLYLIVLVLQEQLLAHANATHGAQQRSCD